jgi:FkbM family methyltransferase
MIRGEIVLERAEINDRWNGWLKRSNWQRLPRWMQWRVTKKVAKWSGRPRRRETELFWGQAMSIVYPEYVSSKIGHDGFFEADLTTMFIDILRPGMVVYDVGSHFGYFSLLASELVGPEGHVFAFEPTEGTYRVVSENASRRENITCNNVAAYSRSGEISFWDQGLDGSSVNFIVNDDSQVDPNHRKRGQMISVPAVRLDDFAAEHGDPDFLKIDAEGAEGPILEGMTELIQRSHPAISLEVGDGISEKTGNKPCRENVNWLLDLGYAVYDYRKCQASAHQVADSYTYDNLLFRHPEWRFAALGSRAAA